MDARERARRLRNYVRKHTADELHKKFKAEGRKNRADREVTEVLRALRVYEYYVKDLEAKYERNLKKVRADLKSARNRVKQLESKLAVYQAHEAAKALGITPEQADTSKLSVKIEARKAQAKKIDAKFEHMHKLAIARNRGEDIGHTVGKNTHASRDHYEALLGTIEKAEVVFTVKQKYSLANSALFKKTFFDRFESKMSAEELTELWNKTFGNKGTTFTSAKEGDGNDEFRHINWVYSPKHRR